MDRLAFFRALRACLVPGNIRADCRGYYRNSFSSGNEYDLGIAAYQFLIYGMGEYARASDKIEYFDFALKLFDSVCTRYETENYKSAHRLLPAGYNSHGKPMILLETGCASGGLIRERSRSSNTIYVLRFTSEEIISKYSLTVSLGSGKAILS